MVSYAVPSGSETVCCKFQGFGRFASELGMMSKLDRTGFNQTQSAIGKSGLTTNEARDRTRDSNQAIIYHYFH